MGWELLNEGIEPPERQALNKEEQPARIKGSFYPLTLPLTVGPGSIAVALTLGTQRPAALTTDPLCRVLDRSANRSENSSRDAGSNHLTNRCCRIGRGRCIG